MPDFGAAVAARTNFALLPATRAVFEKMAATRERILRAQRSDLQASVARFSKYVHDPVGFVTEGVGGFAWSKQREIMLSVRDHRRTAVPSAHDMGKSAIAARIAAWWLACHPPGSAFVVTTAPTWKQVKNILWREITRLHKRAGLPGRTNQTEWMIDEQLVAYGVSPADNDPTSLQGIHERYVLVIVDEACGVAALLWEALDTLIANDDSRMLAIGNPDDPSSQFARVCAPGSGWNVIPISAFDSPNFTDEEVPDWLRPLLASPTWITEKRRTWGTTSPMWMAKVLGEFPKQAADGLVPYDTLAKAKLREAKEGSPRELGVDVARFGMDNTVIFGRAGALARRLFKINGNSTMQVAGAVIQHGFEWKAERIKIDDNGVGGGVTDRLVELQDEVRAKSADKRTQKEKWLADVEIVPVNVGSAPNTDDASEKFANLRAEIHWGMRLRFLDGDIALPEASAGEYDDLLAQAGSIKYKLNSRSQIVIESKDDMKKRTNGVSPDDWDALCLAFAQPSFPGSGFLGWLKEQVQAKEAADA